MRIAYVSHSVLPSRSANSIHVMRMCAALRRNGHDLTLVIPARHGRDTGVADVFDYYGSDARFALDVLPWGNFPGRSYAFAVQAARLALRKKVDLIYTRFLSGAVAAVYLGGRVVFEAHAPAAEQGWMGDSMLASIAGHRRLVRFVAISSVLAAACIARMPRLQPKTMVAHDGADPIVSPPEPMILPGAASGLKVGYVGQLYAGKGIELIARLAPLCPWAQFHVVGGTPGDIERWRATTATVTNLHLHGFVAPRDVPRYLRSFDVVLAPYQRNVSVYGGTGNVAKWMSPLKLFEYMAAGCTIVCSDLPVLREILEHESTALLCEPDDAAAWAAALGRLEADPALRGRLAEAGRRQFELHYTWTGRAHRVLDGL